MPYTKEHKQKTRERILESAFRQFAIKGFEGVTIDELMNHCELTRGAFYAHFTSKSDLYAESLKFAVNSTSLSKLKPEDVSSKEWLGLLLDGYLSLEHVRGKHPCPLAFLATDITLQNDEVKAVYANVFSSMNKIIMDYAKSYTDCNEGDILSVTSMIIGAVAIARTMKNRKSIETLLAACRRDAGLKLGGI